MKNIVSFLLKNPTKYPNLIPRQDRKKDFNLLTIHSGSMPLVDREVTISSIVEGFAVRLYANPTATDPREGNPIAVVCGAPGTGKSRMLDEIALLCGKSEEELQYLPKEMIPLIKSWLPIIVTWNAQTPYREGYDSNDPEGTASLSSRILFTHWFTNMPILAKGFDGFLSIIDEHFTLLKPQTVVSAIMKDTGTNTILLCVDELLKASKEDGKNYTRALNVFHEVCSLLNTFPVYSKSEEKIFCLVSSLNESVMDLDATKSGRPQRKPPLPPLSIKKCIELFQPFLDDVIDMVEYPNNVKCYKQTLLKAIADTGGHPATLEGLRKWLIEVNENNKLRSTSVKLLVQGTYDVSQILGNVRTWSNAFLDLPLLKVIIQGNTYKLDDLIYKGKTFSQLIAEGALFQKEGKPCVTIFALISFYQHISIKFDESKLIVSKDNIPKKINLTDEKLFAICLKKMLDPKRKWESGEQLEEFITFHPIIHSLCTIKNMEWGTIQNLFGKPEGDNYIYQD